MTNRPGHQQFLHYPRFESFTSLEMHESGLTQNGLIGEWLDPETVSRFSRLLPDRDAEPNMVDVVHIHPHMLDLRVVADRRRIISQTNGRVPEGSYRLEVVGHKFEMPNWRDTQPAIGPSEAVLYFGGAFSIRQPEEVEVAAIKFKHGETVVPDPFQRAVVLGPEGSELISPEIDGQPNPILTEQLLGYIGIMKQLAE
ncbi:MAG: hypothetical protein KIH63_004065 [Candidatus Saccharibacteria bacterium]|nr:hypothetical protein [Candidatus Saccharibacteria bacterium]